MAQAKTSKPRRKAAKKQAAAAQPQRKTGTFAALAAAGAIAGIGAALRFGWLDRLFDRSGASAPKASTGGEHPAPDLAPDAPTPGTARAPIDFRPDPTAAVPESEREALRPATGPAPTLAATAGEMANQATPSNA